MVPALLSAQTMPRRHIALGALLVAIVAVGILLFIPSRLGPEHHLPAPQYLPPTARSVLHKRMRRHRADMQELVSAVVLLQYEAAARAAEKVATDASLSRPLEGDASELNTELPERFFALQDQQRAQARKLASAAAAHDPAETANVFGMLARTCVSCHQVYLAGSPAAP